MTSSMTDLTGFISEAHVFVQYAAVIGIIVWLCLRSGSTHMVLARLWPLIHGKLEVGDPVIQAFLKERSSLMQFRVVTGAPARTLPDAHALIKWCHSNNEEVGDVARCSQYFSFGSLELRELPSRKWLVGTAVLICLFALAITAVGFFAASSRALVSVRGGSGTPIFLSASDAYFGWTLGYRLNATDCIEHPTQTIAGTVREPAHDIQVICGWFKDASAPQKVERIVRDQRTGIGSIALMLVLFWVQSFRSLMAGVRARELASRLRKRSTTTESGETVNQSKCARSAPTEIGLRAESTE